jgi:hypothetical protein
MTDELNPQEVAILIRAQQIRKAKSLSKETNVKKICETAGISRKTGYQWANNLNLSDDDERKTEREGMTRLEAEHEKLKKRYRFLKVENEGHKLAWEIHGVDELLAAKKNTIRKSKKKKR